MTAAEASAIGLVPERRPATPEERAALSFAIPTDAEAWHALRARSLGASDAAAATGRSPWTSNVELWQIKTGRKPRPDIGDKPAVKRGHDAEPLVRAMFALDHPEYAVEYRGAFDVVRRPGEPWYIATLDGRLVDIESDAPGILEIKTGALASRAAADAWAGRVPDHYFCQVLHQFNAWPEAQFAVLVAYLEDPGPAVCRTHSTRFYRFDRPDVVDDAAFLFSEERRFWRYVEEDREPPQILPA